MRDLDDLEAVAKDYAAAYEDALRGRPNRMPDIAHKAMEALPDLIARARTAEAEVARLRAGIEGVKHEVDSGHHFHGTTCTCGYDTHGRSRSATEHITAVLIDALLAGGTEGGDHG